MTEQEYIELCNLVGHPGWKIISGYAEKLAAGYVRDLEQRKFTDLGEVALLQGKIQALRAILDYPRTRIEGYEKRQIKQDLPKT